MGDCFSGLYKSASSSAPDGTLFLKNVSGPGFFRTSLGKCWFWERNVCSFWSRKVAPEVLLVKFEIQRGDRKVQWYGICWKAPGPQARFPWTEPYSFPPCVLLWILSLDWSYLLDPTERRRGIRIQARGTQWGGGAETLPGQREACGPCHWGARVLGELQQWRLLHPGPGQCESCPALSQGTRRYSWAGQVWL